MSRLHVFIKQPLQEKLKEVPSDRSNQYLGEIIGVQPTIRSLSDVLQVGTYIYRCKTNFWRLCSLQQMHTFKDYGVQPTIRRPSYLWGYNHLQMQVGLCLWPRLQGELHTKLESFKAKFASLLSSQADAISMDAPPSQYNPQLLYDGFIHMCIIDDSADPTRSGRKKLSCESFFASSPRRMFS